MYLVIKSVGGSTLELGEKSEFIIFVNNSFNDFKLGKSFIVKIFYLKFQYGKIVL